MGRSQFPFGNHCRFHHYYLDEATIRRLIQRHRIRRRASFFPRRQIGRKLRMRWLLSSPCACRNKCLLINTFVTQEMLHVCLSCPGECFMTSFSVSYFFIFYFLTFFKGAGGKNERKKKDDVMICWELARACFSRILIRLARAWHNLSLFLWPIWIPCVKKTRFLFLYSPCRIIGTVRLCGVRKKNPKFFVYVYSLKQKKKRS
jgi:hypothetical protein